jgi:hypothetical protein
MLTKIALFTLVLTPFFAISQADWKTPDALQISGGWSTHGTGDLNGYMLEIAHEHSFNRRFDLTTGIATTAHYDGVYDFGTTSGIQLSTMLNFNALHLLARAPQKIRLGVGPIVRFEHSSTASNYSSFIDPNISPNPIYIFNGSVDNRVFTVGYQVAVGYLAQISKKHQLGFKVGFQNDTDGAVITRIGLVFGRYVKFTENER